MQNFIHHKNKTKTSIILLLSITVFIACSPKQKNSNSASEQSPKHPGYELIWEDNFDGTGLKTDYWTYQTGAHGWGNNELQNYTKGENARIADGKLFIKIKKVDDKKQPGSYTSTRIDTRGKKEFKYGRIEVRAKLPEGKGIWAAIWMLGANYPTVGWPECGEMDIMEYVGYAPDTIHSTVHTPTGYAGNGNGSNKQVRSCEEEFHVYGLDWKPEKLVFYIDKPENIIHSYAPENKTNKNWPFNNPAFIILNVAVGGDWGGLKGVDNSIFPQTMEIDYIKVFQKTK